MSHHHHRPTDTTTGNRADPADAVQLDVIAPQLSVSNHYELTRLHRVAGRIVRVRVRRDFYPQQSSATVALLSRDGNWTELTRIPTADWYQHTSYQPDHPRKVLRPVTEELTNRAVALLTG
ncbi:MAG: hypothetical protein ACRD0P_15985 [Stackebrandtia sp.]